MEENDGDESRPEYLCPFCAEDFDIVGLCCHIDEEHTVQARNGVLLYFLLFFSLVEMLFSFEFCVNCRYARYVRKRWERVWLAILRCNMEIF